MNPNKQFSYSHILPVLTALAVCLFFGGYYPHHLHYQEQFQLFLFDSDYAHDVMCVPGGIADYCGRFITQFYFFAWTGAILLCILIASIQYLAARSLGKGWLASLQLLPSLLLVRWLCDENALTGTLIAILFSQLFALGISKVQKHPVRKILAIILLPMLYWAAGPIAILYVALVVIDELSRERSLSVAGYLAALVIVALALPALLSHYVATEPQYLYQGIHYTRAHGTNDTAYWYAILFIVLLTALCAFWPKTLLPARNNWLPFLGSLLVGIGGSYWIVTPEVNPKAENVMAYDYMARMQQWNRIQQTAIEKAPNNALCTTALNLAMAKTGRINEHLFDFVQHGTRGLLPNFGSDAMSPLTTSEVYYHLGMINTAQRYTFEAQEAILDYQKSGRCYKRLAETNLINGNYAVARKYLSALQKTIFYSDWANETLQLIGNEEAINKHKEYGELRRNSISLDTFYNENDYIGMLTQLYLSNRSNRMAYEYLLSACMLEKDLNRFVESFGLNQEIQYSSTPVLFQQALVLWWSLTHSGNDSTPPGIQPEVANGLKQFVRDTKQQQNAAILEKRYGKTFWNYYITR